MDLGSDAEWILSRKIVVKSVTRHFAPWKSRFFLLDRVNAMLEIRTSATSGATRVPLTSSNLVIQRHEYSADNGYLLTIRYNDENTITIREVVMKFDSLDHLSYWEKALKSTAENVQSVTTGSTLALLQSFMEFTNEQLQLQTIVESESQYEAQYFNTAVGSKKTDTPGSLDVSFMDASSTISTGDDASSGGTAPLHLQPVTVSESESDGPLPLPPGAIKISPLRVPHMHILLVAVGTRGDMQPFVQLGLRLLQDGHRVRLATHACFRDAVTSKGLEFYPLAGDPLKLSEFMVKTQGFVIPTTPELLMEAPIYHRMVVDMMYSCWGACVDPDPEDPLARKFVADAIISNPVSYAHIHCAEALGVPLHLMFPQPWTPTKAFPHPLSCLSYQQGWSSENYISYQVVDSMLWMSFERHINAFRTAVLGLEPLRVGEGGWNHLNVMQVPFAKMWSPSFVPKPKDWPAHVDVVGTFFDAPAILSTYSAGDNSSTISSADKPSTAHADAPHGLAVPRVEIDFQPPADLARFLESGEAPVFVGFGSMVVKDLEGLISLFLEGAALAGVRIIVQLGWTAISSERFLELALQAQLKASIVRETEQLHDAMASSVIFPSSNSSALPGRGRSGPLEGSVLRGGNLAMSMRSVESTSTMDEDVSRDESTLDGEAVLSNVSGFISGTVSGKNCVSGMYTSSVTAQSLDTPVCAPMRRSEEGGDFDSSPISTPERDSTECAAGPEQGGENSGLGTWLYGAAAKLGRSFQQQRGKQNPSLQSPTSGPDGHAAPSGRGGAVQDDWDEVTVEGWTAARDALFIGPCPHDWLFQRVAGVVHHGGAGTTAAGLRFGRPTWVCPFFGDQHFWGEMVYRRRVGPKPCPIGALTLPVVADSLSMLVDREMAKTAAVLARSMAAEDGVETACSAFYKHLPLESMLCDVSLFRGEHRLAQVYCQDCGLKMCLEVSLQVHSAPGLHLQDHRPAPCCYKDWTRPAPNSAADGLLQGIGGLVHELKEGVSDLVYDPVQGIYTHGISGAAAGLSSGLHSLLSRPLAGGSVLLNKVKEGIRASLASNLQYGVATSPYDPLLRDGMSATGTGRGSPILSQDIQHRRSGSHNPSRIRSLKLALPELPPVSDASFGTVLLSPPAPVSQAALGGSLMLLGSALGGGRSSPRGRRVASEDDGDSIPDGLNTSRHTVASRDSAAFYCSCSKDSVLSPTGEVSDGDESECYEEDTAPFLLYNSQTEPAAATAQPPVQASYVALSSSTVSSHSGDASTEIPGIEGRRAQGTTATRAGAGAEKEQASPQGKPVVSVVPSIDTRRMKEGSPSNHAYPSRRGAHPAKVSTLTIRTQDPAPSDSAVDMTVKEAFTTAQAARKLFTDLGAQNGRFITPSEFGRVMHRACQREVAMCEADPQQQQQVHCGAQSEADSSSATVLSPAQQLPSKVGGVDGTGYNEQSLAALLQMLAHGKRYVDFVDFALIYRDLHALAPAPPPQQH